MAQSTNSSMIMHEQSPQGQALAPVSQALKQQDCKWQHTTALCSRDAHFEQSWLTHWTMRSRGEFTAKVAAVWQLCTDQVSKLAMQQLSMHKLVQYTDSNLFCLSLYLSKIWGMWEHHDNQLRCIMPLFPVKDCAFESWWIPSLMEGLGHLWKKKNAAFEMRQSQSLACLQLHRLQQCDLR